MNTSVSISTSGALKSNSLIIQQFYYFVVCTVLEFAVVYVLLLHYGSHICNDTSYTREPWTQNFNIFVCGAFVVTVTLNVIRIHSGVIYSEHHNMRSTLFAILTVNSIASLSALTTAFSPNGTCTDFYGVQLNAEIYPEWLASVPLLGLMAISVDGKKSYDIRDKLFVTSLFCCILFGGLTVFKIFHSDSIASIFMFISCVSFGMFMYLAEIMIGECFTVLSENQFSPKNAFRVHLASRKILLLRFLTVLFPVFPAIYLLMALKMIDSNTGDACLMGSSAISKLVFASLCTDAKLEITHPSAYANEIRNKLNAERRTFLRYMFHELRVPLNSISLGIQYVLESISDETPNDATNKHFIMRGHSSEESSEIDTKGLNEALAMISESSVYMDTVLNDVFSIHKIEEGILKLKRTPFSIKSLLSLTVEPFLHVIDKNKLKLTVNLEKDIPFYVKGDKYQLNHIVAKLIYNAIRFSKKNGKVSLTVTSPREPYTFSIENQDNEDPNVIEFNDTIVRDYIIEVSDEGIGMPEQLMTNIFNPFAKTRSGNVGRGTGLGLVVCKEIVELHGGELTCESTLGNGTSFKIKVPLEFLSTATYISFADKDELKQSQHSNHTTTSSRSYYTDNYSTSAPKSVPISTDSEYKFSYSSNPNNIWGVTFTSKQRIDKLCEANTKKKGKSKRRNSSNSNNNTTTSNNTNNNTNKTDGIKMRVASTYSYNHELLPGNAKPSEVQPDSSTAAASLLVANNNNNGGPTRRRKSITKFVTTSAEPSSSSSSSSSMVAANDVSQLKHTPTEHMTTTSSSAPTTTTTTTTDTTALSTVLEDDVDDESEDVSRMGTCTSAVSQYSYNSFTNDAKVLIVDGTYALYII